MRNENYNLSLAFVWIIDSQLFFFHFFEICQSQLVTSIFLFTMCCSYVTFYMSIVTHIIYIVVCYNVRCYIDRKWKKSIMHRSTSFMYREMCDMNDKAKSRQIKKIELNCTNSTSDDNMLLTNREKLNNHVAWIQWAIWMIVKLCTNSK